MTLRDKLHQLIVENVDDVDLNGHPVERLPNTLNLSFKGVFGAAVLAELPEIAASRVQETKMPLLRGLKLFIVSFQIKQFLF
ncbi:MAG: hypothetical protein ACOY4Q_11010 [Bacillota bacterium]